MENQTPLLLQAQDVAARVLEDLNRVQEEVKACQGPLRQQEEALQKMKVEVKYNKAECTQAFSQVVPELQKAVNGLSKLTKAQMTEMKSMKIPSKAILTLMTGICIMLGVEPKMVKREGSYTQYDEDWWSSCTSSKVLANHQLQDILINFKSEKLDSQTMRRLDVVIKDEEFTLANITRASKAAQGKSPRP